MASCLCLTYSHDLFQSHSGAFGGYLYLHSLADMEAATDGRNVLHFAGFLHVWQNGGRHARSKQNPGFLLSETFPALSNECCDHCPNTFSVNDVFSPSGVLGHLGSGESLPVLKECH